MNRFVKGLSYTFSRNIGFGDRLIRTLSALIVIILWYFQFITGVIGIGLFILSLMLLGTVASARCGVTYWFDSNTMSKKEKSKLDSKGIKYE